MTILDDIIAAKKKRLPEKVSLTNRIALPEFLVKGKSQIIGEVKKGSPSLGLKFPDLDVEKQARAYQEAGVSAISVLTEEDFFYGSQDDLKRVRQTVTLPILRKDFILTEGQILESKNMGASAILLIVKAFMSSEELCHLMSVCNNVQINALVEVHDKDELEMAINAGAKIIGVNNRNLETFETNIQQSLDLIGQIPDEIITVSESGIHHPDQVQKLFQAGFDALLIGEGFLSDPTFLNVIKTTLNS